MRTKTGFTLAEALIALVIIGVIATLVIPTLVSKFNEKSWDTSSKVFNRRIEVGIKTMRVDRLLTGHSSTLEFVNEFKNYFKISNICDNDNLQNCFSDTVYWGGGDAEPNEVDMTRVKTSRHFGLKEWGTELIGLQFPNGTNALIAYNPACSQKDYNNCIAMLYDTSGYKKPNTSGKDMRSYGNIPRLGNYCAFEIGGACYGTPFYPDPMTYEECAGENAISAETETAADAEAQALGISQCYYANDYWAGAVKACGGIDKMPTMAQLAELVNQLYPDAGGVIGAYTDWTCPNSTSCRQDSSLGFANSTGSSTFSVWSGKEYSSTYAYNRHFYPTSAYYSINGRDISNRQAVCLGD